MSNIDSEIKKVVQAILKIEAKKKLKKDGKLDEYFKDARLRSRKIGGYI